MIRLHCSATARPMFSRLQVYRRELTAARRAPDLHVSRRRPTQSIHLPSHPRGGTMPDSGKQKRQEKQKQQEKEESITRKRLVELLNEDLAREYQAIISYVVYSQVLKGAPYMAIAAELETHAAQELEHAL